MRSVQMQRTHKVYVVGTELCVFQKRRESSLDKLDTLFGRVLRLSETSGKFA